MFFLSCSIQNCKKKLWRFTAGHLAVDPTT
jgi:hypothetical protein